MESSIQDFFLFIEGAKYGALLLSLIIIISTFVLEDPTTLFVGHLIQQQQLSYLNGFIALMIGIFIGDFFLYLSGRYLGKKKYKWTENLRKYNTNLHTLLFIARFIPGMRITFYPYSGLQGVSLYTFIVINLASSILWTALLLKGAGKISSILSNYPYYYFLLFILGVLIIEFLIRRIVSKKVGKKHIDNITKT